MRPPTAVTNAVQEAEEIEPIAKRSVSCFSETNSKTEGGFWRFLFGRKDWIYRAKIWFRSWRSDGIKHKKNEIFLDVVTWLHLTPTLHIFILCATLSHSAVIRAISLWHQVGLWSSLISWPGRTLELISFCQWLRTAFRDPRSSQDEAQSWGKPRKAFEKFVLQIQVVDIRIHNVCQIIG